MTQFLSAARADWCLTNSESDVIVGEQEFLPKTAKQQWAVLKPVRSVVDRKSVFIRNLADDRVCLRDALPVVVENWGDQVTVYSPDTGDFGVGEDELSAIDHFRAAVVDLYFMLKSESDALGPLPQRHWDFLRSIIVEP